MANRMFDLGDVISFIGDDGEKFIVVDDIPEMGVYVNRIINGKRGWEAMLIPNRDNYMKVGSWDYRLNKEIEDG